MILFDRRKTIGFQSVFSGTAASMVQQTKSLRKKADGRSSRQKP
jgi:hypothetical protein